MEDRYITIKEASNILGVTPLTLRNWDKKGLLVAHRNPLNNYRLYLYSEVANLISRIQKPTAIQAASTPIPPALPDSLAPPIVISPASSVQKLEVKFLDEEDLPQVSEI